MILCHLTTQDAGDKCATEACGEPDTQSGHSFIKKDYSPWNSGLLKFLIISCITVILNSAQKKHTEETLCSTVYILLYLNWPLVLVKQNLLAAEGQLSQKKKQRFLVTSVWKFKSRQKIKHNGVRKSFTNYQSHIHQI